MSCKMTVTLNNEAGCRYQVNGDKQLLHWQVLQSALHELFLMGSGKDRELVWNSLSN